jgi:hypothetical protein
MSGVERLMYVAGRLLRVECRVLVLSIARLEPAVRVGPPNQLTFAYTRSRPGAVAGQAQRPGV